MGQRRGDEGVPRDHGQVRAECQAADGLYLYGVAKAETFVQALYKTGKNPSRAGLMAALLSMNSANKFALPGVMQKTSRTDHWVISQMQLEKYTRADWELQGKLIEGRPR